MQHFKRAFVALAVWAAAIAAASAETPVGKAVESRVIMAFDPGVEAVAPLYPDGWEPIAFPSGPFAGATFMLTLIDKTYEADAEGKPKDGGMSRAAVFVGLAKPTEGEGARLYVLRVYAEEPGADPYGNSVQASISRTSSTDAPAEGPRRREDTWRIKGEDGASIEVTLSFTQGKHVWAPGEARPWSNANPDFSRIYRYDRLFELVSSEAVGKPIAGSVSVDMSGADLAEVLGNAQPVAILDIPMNIRDISLP